MNAPATAENSTPGKAATAGQRRARRLRQLLWGTIALALAGALGFAFRPQPVLVDLTAATRGELTTTIDEEGETRVRDVHVVSAPVAGRMLRIEVEPGDSVVGGETVVAEIEPRDPDFLDLRSESQARADISVAEAARALADAELAQARAEHEFAAAEHWRMQRLHARGSVSEHSLQAAHRAARVAAAAVDTGRARQAMRASELARARATLLSPLESQARAQRGACECVPVLASTNGEVLRVLHESEGVVVAGESLLEIGDAQDLEVRVEMLSTEAVRLEPGMQAWIEGWGAEPRLTGSVRRVEPYGFTKVSALGIEEQRVNVLIDPAPDSAADGAGWAALRHGFRVEVRVVTWRGRDVLKVPATALFKRRDRWLVFVESDGVAREREVVPGNRTPREVEISTGLAEGEQVVTYPSDRIEDGVRIADRGRA